MLHAPSGRFRAAAVGPYLPDHHRRRDHRHRAPVSRFTYMTAGQVVTELRQ
jgi:hypothetical protein